MYDQDEQNNSVSRFGNSFTDMVWKGNRKWILMVVILLIIGVVGFVIYKRRNKFGSRRH